MRYFFIVLTLLLVYIIQKARIDIISKVVLYCFIGYWMTALILSTYHFFGIFEVSDYSYICLVTGVLFFVIGMFVVKSPLYASWLRERHLGSFDNAVDSFITNKFFLCLILGTSIFGFMYAREALAIAVIGGKAEMWDKGDLIFGGNTIAIQYYTNIMTPLFHISTILALYIIIKKKYIRFLLQFVSFISCIVSFSILAGSRNIFVIIFLYAILCYFLLNSKRQISKVSIKQYLSIAIIAILVIQGITLMTNYRKEGTFTSSTGDNDSQSSLEMVYKYSELPFVLFDRAIQYNYLQKFDYQYGRLTLSGLDYWFVNFINRTGAQFESSQKIVQYLDDNYFPYSKEDMANYAYTAFFYNYIDFGYIGIIIFPFIFGVIFRKCINRFIVMPSMYSFFLICFYFFILMHTIFSCYFNKPWVIVFVLFLYIMDRKNNFKQYKIS